MQLGQLILIGLLLRPANAQALLFVRLGYHVHVNVIDDLVRYPAIVLQNIEVLCTCGFGDTGSDW